MQKHVQTGVPFHKNLTTDAFSSFGRKSRYVWILSLRQRRWPNSCLLDGAGQEAEAVRRRAPRRRDPVAAICAATGWTPGCSGWWRSAALDTSQGLSHRIPATIVSGTCMHTLWGKGFLQHTCFNNFRPCNGVYTTWLSYLWMGNFPHLLPPPLLGRAPCQHSEVGSL